MNLKKYYVFAAFFLSFAAFSAYAAIDPFGTTDNIKSAPVVSCDAPLPKDRELELADIINRTMCNNPQTRQSWRGVLARAAELGSAKSAYLPSVDGSVSLNQNNENVSGGSNSSSTVLLPELSLSYLLFDFGGRKATSDVAKQALIASDYSHNSTIQNVLFEAVKTYYMLYSAMAAADAIEEDVKSKKASLDAATLRHKIGAATISDKLQAETSYAQSLLEKEQADNQIRVAKGTLANIMGINPDYNFIISVKKPNELNANIDEDIENLLELAKQNRPDLAAKQAEVAQAKAAIDYEKASGRPAISASAGVNRREILSGSDINRDNSSVGITLSVPIFSGFNRSYKVAAARENLKIKEAEFERESNDILLDVWTSYNNFLTEKQTLKMVDTLITSAKKSEQVSMGRYKAGAGSFTDLLIVQSQLADARKQHVQSYYNYLVAKADLLRAIGRLEKDNIGNR